MAHTINEFTFNGGTTFNLSFSGGYRVRQNVTAYKEGLVRTPIAFNWVTNNQVQIIPTGLVNGDKIAFVRTVSKLAPPIDLLQPANFTREAVLAAVQHTLQALQEVLDGRVDSFTGEFINRINNYIEQMELILDEVSSSASDADLSQQQAEASAVAAAAARDIAVAARNTTTASRDATLAYRNTTAIYLQQAEDLVGAAILIGNQLHFNSYIQALAAVIPESTNYITITVNNVVVALVRDEAGTCLDGGWSPASLFCSLRHWGVVPGNQSPEQVARIKAAFAFRGGIIMDKGGDYTINNDTIPVIHPLTFEGAGKGRTRFIFFNMGGFSGKDGFDVQVGLDSQRNSLTAIRNCDVLAAGGFGRVGIRTPTNHNGEGLILYARVRPQYDFSHTVVGSRDRTAIQSSNMFGIDGWQTCILVGESSDSILEHIQFIQPFVPNIPQAEWAGRELCRGLYIDAGVTAEGSGPVYHPRISHITGHGCGKMVSTRGKVISARVTELDGFGNGWNFHAVGPFFNTSGQLDGLGELTMDSVNLNGIFGGIFIEGTDYLDLRAIRTSWPSSAMGTIDYTGDWYGLQITGGFRQVDIDGFRAASFSAGAGATFRAIDLNGRTAGFPTDVPGVVNIKKVFITTGGSANWEPPYAFRNVREGKVEPPTVRTTAPLSALLYLESDHGSGTAPTINMLGPLPDNITEPAVYGTGVSANMVNWPRVNEGLTVATAISSSATINLNARGVSNYRQAMLTGAAPYTVDIVIGNSGAVHGQEMSFYISVQQTNPTVRFIDEAGTTRLSLQPAATNKAYMVIVTWVELAGVRSMRIKYAGESLV